MSNVPAGGVAFDDAVPAPVVDGGCIMGFQYRRVPPIIRYGVLPMRFQQPVPMLFRKCGGGQEFELVTLNGEALTIDGEPVTL
jgi:hypothetical protein